MHALIENYLRIRGIRYFRGHHDGEYLFLVDSPGAVGKMHVRLAAVGRQVRITVTPDRYYPVDQRDRLAGLAARWEVGAAAEAVLEDSSDPALVGVVARACTSPNGLADLTDFVDGAVAASVDLFTDLRGAA